MKTHPAHRVALAVLTTLVLVTACDTGTPSGSSSSSTTVPTTTSTTVPPTSTTTTTTEPTGTQVVVKAYYVGSTTHGDRLFRETHQVTTGDPKTAAVAEALGKPVDPDYWSQWTGLGVTVNSVTKSGGTIVVDLHGISGLRTRPAGMTKAQAADAVDQILWTVKDAYNAGNKVGVQILSDGSHQDSLLGVPIAEPVAFPDWISTLAHVWITVPQEGDSVTSPVTVEGLGAAFEAQLVWRVYDASGKLVKKGTTLAAECCLMAPYSFTVKLAPGTYSIVVEDTDPSGGMSPGPWQDSKTVTVS